LRSALDRVTISPPFLVLRRWPRVIQYRVLGSTELVRRTSDDVPRLLERPKRLALLTYLLVARPRGFHRRDHLLALFWPELRDARARHGLRQALYELRRELGPMIAVRGAHDVGVVPGTVWCDAVAFDEAIAECDLARAVQLYRGDLLGGLSVRSASVEFQDWLDRERSGYRDQAARAACGLAERAAADGNPSSAVRWARRAAGLTPLDEAVLSRSLMLYRHLGYRAAAESLYREYARRLHADLALVPSTKVESLIRTIRNSGGTARVR